MLKPTISWFQQLRVLNPFKLNSSKVRASERSQVYPDDVLHHLPFSIKLSEAEKPTTDLDELQ